VAAGAVGADATAGVAGLAADFLFAAGFLAFFATFFF